jgi:antitoxin VapB
MPTVSLNIKNERVHELARQAARRTGKSQTAVIEEALERYVGDLERHDRRVRADASIAELQRAVREQGGLAMHPEDLYDRETGLPA